MLLDQCIAVFMFGAFIAIVLGACAKIIDSRKL